MVQCKLLVDVPDTATVIVEGKESGCNKRLFTYETPSEPYVTPAAASVGSKIERSLAKAERETLVRG